MADTAVVDLDRYVVSTEFPAINGVGAKPESGAVAAYALVLAIRSLLFSFRTRITVLPRQDSYLV